MAKGRTGASTNVEMTQAMRKRALKRRLREEAAWRAKNGPVTVRFVDPKTLRKP